MPTVQPLVYGSYQAYLKRYSFGFLFLFVVTRFTTIHRTPSHILQSIQDAKAGGYSLGVKLVRGAYHPFEVATSSSPETCPVWAEKMETDACYNQCVALLVSALREDLANELPQIGTLFGTHNSQSCERILNGLVHEGIAEDKDGLIYLGEAVSERCTIGQLYGTFRSWMIRVHY